MGRIHYSVLASLPDEPTAEAYLAWLAEGHVREVLAGGALSCAVVRLLGPGDGPPVRVRTSYIFPDRESFDRYERETAPALRADGVQRFGSIEGVEFSRSIGEEAGFFDSA